MTSPNGKCQKCPSSSDWFRLHPLGSENIQEEFAFFCSYLVQSQGSGNSPSIWSPALVTNQRISPAARFPPSASKPFDNLLGRIHH